MKKSKRYSVNSTFLTAILVLATFISGCGSGGGSSEPPLPPVSSTLTETLNNYLTTNQSTDTPGLSISVIKGSEIVYQKGRGIANNDTALSITKNTGFRIASITKSFTALAIMQLVELGLLRVDDKLISLLPELSIAYQDITIHQLLSHQSGIPDYINDSDDPTVWDNVTTTEFMATNSSFNELEFTPGSSAQYSNTGYVLLAVIIERLTGMSFPDYVEENIFIPLGMNNSYVINEYHQLGEFGEESALNNGNTTNVLNFNSLIYGSANVVSSVDDMTLFIKGWLEDELISVELKSLMLQTHSSIPNIGDYGYGWIVDNGLHSYEDNDYWHTGGYDFYQTALYFSPNADLVIVAFSNGGAVTRGHIDNMVELTRRFYGR